MQVGIAAGRHAEIRAHYQALVEQVPAIIYIDLPQENRTAYVSPQIEAILGVTPADWLLHAIPANVPPPRVGPRGGERVPDLCAGTIATAERLRHLAHTTAARPPAQTAMAASWQRTAQGAAITGHCAELILRQLATPAAQPPGSPATGAALQLAGDAVSQAWAAWRTLTHHWDAVTTGPGITLTPVAAETGDLALWAGRLAHTDPAWTPARSHASPLRTSTDLAASPETLGGTLAALHHASTVLADIAAIDRDSVRAAAALGRLYVPTRLLPANSDWPYRYVPAHPGMTEGLLASYDTAVQTAGNAVTALGELATALNIQPTVMAGLPAVTALIQPLIKAAPAGPPPGRSPGQRQEAPSRHSIATASASPHCWHAQPRSMPRPRP